MKTYTAAQVREAEGPYLRSGVPLMARASAALADQTAELLTARRGSVPGSRVLVLAGPGNNGGDALHAGALLAAQGARVSIAATGGTLHEEGRAAAAAVAAAFLPLSAPVEAVAQAAAVSDVLLDGILGTGTSSSPALRGRARDLVAAILPLLGPAGPAVVAVDLPSGIGPDDGAVPDPTVLKADMTVTFGGCKAGLVREPAAGLAGRIVVADIGITEELERISARDRG
jgi:hydroxyethylthiazole kinase-like uncharacterized protein yjeF